MWSLFWGMDVCCLGMQSCIQTYFDDRICSGISEWPKQHFKWCEARSVRWLVKISRPIVQSHITFLMRKVKFMCFHCSLCTFFCYWIKGLSYSIAHISVLYGFSEFMRILAFPSRVFLISLFQSVHKNRWMETAILGLYYSSVTLCVMQCYSVDAATANIL